jgi:DNA-binding response OmpR family regulator
MSSNFVLLLDEQDSRRSLHAFGLRCAGFDVAEAVRIDDALGQIAERCPGLVLVVRSRLESDACGFIAQLRADVYTRDLAILLAVEHSTRAEAARAYDCGASDFICGSVAPEDLVARVRAGLHGAAAPASTTANIVDLTVDAAAVRKGSRAAALRPAERRLLQFMLGHTEQVIPRDLLLFRIWGGGATQDSRVVDVTVCRLRRALAEIGCGGLLQTVNRRGYKFSNHQRETQQ